MENLYQFFISQNMTNIALLFLGVYLLVLSILINIFNNEKGKVYLHYFKPVGLIPFIIVILQMILSDVPNLSLKYIQYFFGVLLLVPFFWVAKIINTQNKLEKKLLYNVNLYNSQPKVKNGGKLNTYYIYGNPYFFKKYFTIFLDEHYLKFTDVFNNKGKETTYNILLNISNVSHKNIIKSFLGTFFNRKYIYKVDIDYSILTLFITFVDNNTLFNEKDQQEWNQIMNDINHLNPISKEALEEFLKN